MNWAGAGTLVPLAPRRACSEGPGTAGSVPASTPSECTTDVPACGTHSSSQAPGQGPRGARWSAPKASAAALWCGHRLQLCPWVYDRRPHLSELQLSPGACW